MVCRATPCVNALCILFGPASPLVRVLQRLPEAPVELVTELARRYVLLYEMITGREFQIQDLEEDPQVNMAAAVKAAMKG